MPRTRRCRRHLVAYAAVLADRFAPPLGAPSDDILDDHAVRIDRNRSPRNVRPGKADQAGQDRHRRENRAKAEQDDRDRVGHDHVANELSGFGVRDDGSDRQRQKYARGRNRRIPQPPGR